jgi:aspartate-semialdehyde dehydrogenase
MRTLAVVHPTTLLGKELRERLESRPDLCRELRLLSLDEAEVGTVTEAAGAAAFVTRLEADSFDGVDLAFFCGDVARDRPALDRMPAGVPAVLLSRGATLADAPAAIAGVRTESYVGFERVTSPDPAAIAVALLLSPLLGRGLRCAVGTIVVPVSNQGEPGVDELFEQTRSILTFAGRKHGPLYPAQIAFNLLPAADDAVEVERFVRQALGSDAPVSLQLVQSGVFHGLAVSLRVELETPVGATALRRSLAHAPGIAAARETPALGPVAAAGEENLLLGEVREAEEPGAYWIWAVMDNLVRGGALNAIEVAATLLAVGRPS